MSITTHAAIARGPHTGWEMVDLKLDEPKAHEVRVKFCASGLCHSDNHITKGDARPRFPIVGGHEGAGIVESVGPDVRRVKAGDRLICSYIPACGACRPCSTGHQNMCVKGLNAGSGMSRSTNSQSPPGLLICAAFIFRFINASSFACVLITLSNQGPIARGSIELKPLAKDAFEYS